MPPEEDEPMEMKVRREELSNSRAEKAERGTGRFSVRDSDTAANRERERKQDEKQSK